MVKGGLEGGVWGGEEVAEERVFGGMGVSGKGREKAVDRRLKENENIHQYSQSFVLLELAACSHCQPFMHAMTSFSLSNNTVAL